MSNTLDKARSIYHECVREGTHRQGIQTLSAMIAEGMEASEVFQLRASLHAIVGDVAQAKRDLDRAIEIGPKSGGLYYDRGALHHRMKAYRLALADLCEAVLRAHEAGDEGLIDAAEHHFVAIFEEMREA